MGDEIQGLGEGTATLAHIAPTRAYWIYQTMFHNFGCFEGDNPNNFWFLNRTTYDSRIHDSSSKSRYFKRVKNKGGFTILDLKKVDEDGDFPRELDELLESTDLLMINNETVYSLANKTLAAPPHFLNVDESLECLGMLEGRVRVPLVLVKSGILGAVLVNLENDYTHVPAIEPRLEHDEHAAADKGIIFNSAVIATLAGYLGEFCIGSIETNALRNGNAAAATKLLGLRERPQYLDVKEMVETHY